MQKINNAKLIINKILLLIGILFLTSCSSDDKSSIKAHAYFVDTKACETKQISSCPILPISEILFTTEKHTFTVSYREVALNNPSNQTYGKLKNCTIFDNENFRCDDLELIDGRFHVINAFAMNGHGEIVKNNNNFFSNYFAISSSKSLYYMNAVKPIVPLSLFNHISYEIIYVVMLLMLIFIPFGIVLVIYGLGIYIFEFLKYFFCSKKN